MTAQTTYQQQNASVTTIIEQGRRSKEITIKMTQMNKDIQNLLQPEILQNIKTELGEYAHKTIALHQLPNNNLILVIMEAGVKEELTKYSNEWLEKAIPGTTIYKKIYPVIVHSIDRKTVDTTN